MGQQIFWSRVDGDGGAGMMKYPLSAMILPVFELVKISINIDKYIKRFMAQTIKAFYADSEDYRYILK